MVRKRIALDWDDFTKFVVCQKCKALYPFSACTKKNNREQIVAVPCKNKVFVLYVVPNLSKKLWLKMDLVIIIQLKPTVSRAS